METLPFVSRIWETQINGLFLLSRRLKLYRRLRTAYLARMKAGTLQAHGVVVVEPTMDLEHVARAVVHMASLSLDTNVQFLAILATKMPFIGRGDDCGGESFGGFRGASGFEAIS